MRRILNFKTKKVLRETVSGLADIYDINDSGK